MAILNISINVPDEDFHQVLHTLSSFQVLLEPPGVNLYRIADKVSNGKPITIFATGSLRDTDPSAVMSDGWDTFYLAKWIKDHPGSSFHTVEIDPDTVERCWEFLKKHDLDWCVNLICADSIKAIERIPHPVDLFVLDSCDGLEHGLAEFQAALKHKPRFIVMDDWDKKVLKAAEYANEQGIFFQRIDRYTVFKIR
jgi:hypothetical protein